jgi:hypothetical protein
MGKFKKGQSGNPSGRPKDDVKELARAHGPSAIERLVHWLHSDNAKASVSASTILLERGYGKVPQALIGDDSADPIRVSEASDDQRARALAVFMAKNAGKTP